MRRACIVLVVTFVALPSWSIEVGTTGRQASEPTSIDGSVVDSAGIGQNGFVVSAIRSGNAVADTTTKDGGKYTLNVPGSGRFDVAYELTGWRNNVLVGFADQARHTVKKVMIRQTEPADTQAIKAEEFANVYLAGVRRRPR